jgi:hypothetical protein
MGGEVFGPCQVKRPAKRFGECRPRTANYNGFSHASSGLPK